MIWGLIIIFSLALFALMLFKPRKPDPRNRPTINGSFYCEGCAKTVPYLASYCPRCGRKL